MTPGPCEKRTEVDGQVYACVARSPHDTHVFVAYFPDSVTEVDGRFVAVTHRAPHPDRGAPEP